MLRRSLQCFSNISKESKTYYETTKDRDIKSAIVEQLKTLETIRKELYRSGVHETIDVSLSVNVAGSNIELRTCFDGDRGGFR